MLSKSLSDITTDDLEALVRDQVPEGRTLDYKRDLKLSTDDDKRELARDVSSFANAAGGDLVWGIEETKDSEGRNLGMAGRIIGVQCPNADSTRQRLEQIVRDTIDPRIHGIEVRMIGAFAEGPVIVMRVPRSWNAPHMVQFRNQTHFYSRNSTGKVPLDVREIRAAFLGSSGIASAVLQFRDARLGQIIAGETPVTLRSTSKVVLHAIPLLSFRDGQALDLTTSLKDCLVPLGYSAGRSTRYNVDGFVAASGSGGGNMPSVSYSLLFRQGQVEGVTCAPVSNSDNGLPILHGLGVEKEVLEAVQGYLQLLGSLGIAPPVSIHLSLLGVKGVRVATSRLTLPGWEGMTIDRDVVVLPDVLLDNPASAAKGLKPLFDAMWQSSGIDGSPSYTPSGEWNPKGRD